MLKPNLTSVKDKKVIDYINYLESITKNSRFNTFLALRQQADSFNEQLTIKTEKKPHPSDPSQTIEVKSGYVDLFADKEAKEFDRVWKYMQEADGMEDNLQKMYEKMLPEEKEQAKKFTLGSSAEKHIFGK